MSLARDPSLAVAPQFAVIPEHPNPWQCQLQRLVDGGTNASSYKATFDQDDIEFARHLASLAAADAGVSFDPEACEPLF